MKALPALDPTPFADVLTALGERDGRSWRQIAIAAELDPSYLTRLRNRDRQPPSRMVIRAIAEALGLPAADTADLLGAAGFTVSPRKRGVVIVRPQLVRPVVRCTACGRQWYAWPGHAARCATCEVREYEERARRIARFEPRSVVVKRKPVRRKPIESLPAPNPGERRCKGCTDVFPEAVMRMVHLVGFFCRACHREYLDRLCGEKSAS